MKNVLILTDFSRCAHNAMQYALEFLNHKVCTFYIMHVHKTGSFTLDDFMTTATANVYETVIKSEKERLKKMATDLMQSATNKKHTFTTIIDYDNFIEAINQAVEANDIDLIVAGFNGTSNVSEVFFGSNTLNIIRHVNCTTLVIPEEVTFQRPKTMLLPLDSKDIMKSKAFSDITDVVKEQRIKLDILRVCPKNTEDNTHNIDDKLYLEYHLHNVKYTYQNINGVPLQYVNACYLQMHQIDIIGLIVQKESLAERLFGNSTTTEISKTLKVPLLVTHAY